MIRPDQLLCSTPSGLYCPPGDFYIDPLRKADRAVITHGHADHARKGHGSVLATPATLALMEARYGASFCRTRQSQGYGARISVNGVSVRLVPAGHVLGSAQVVVEYKGLKMICSGDYKRRPDPTCASFEVEACHVFITEATFALPVFRHPDDRGEIRKLLDSLATFPDRTHFVGAYSLGKAQRVILLLREAGYNDTILVHSALENINAVYDNFGVDLGRIQVVNGADASQTGERLLIGPPQALTDALARRFRDPVRAFASGWMRIRARARQSGVELPLIVSDHADWDELTGTIRDIDPEELWITHGRDDALVRWAELEGRRATPLKLVGYEAETE